MSVELEVVEEHIVGLDLSLVATGMFTGDGGPQTIRTRTRGVERLDELLNLLGTRLLDAEVVVLEGYAFNSKFRNEGLAEMGGVLRLWLHQHGIPFVPIPPAILKKWATGRGNAPKQEVLIAALRHLPDAGIANDNEADAWWLYHMGRAHYLGAPVNQVRKELLAKVEWPRLKEVAGV